MAYREKYKALILKICALCFKIYGLYFWAFAIWFVSITYETRKKAVFLHVFSSVNWAFRDVCVAFSVVILAKQNIKADIGGIFLAFYD